jgi:hypothetical protein
MNSAPLADLGETAIPQSKCDAASPPSRVSKQPALRRYVVTRTPSDTHNPFSL